MRLVDGNARWPRLPPAHELERFDLSFETERAKRREHGVGGFPLTGFTRNSGSNACQAAQDRMAFRVSPDSQRLVDSFIPGSRLHFRPRFITRELTVERRLDGAMVAAEREANSRSRAFADM
jgi:hypothetical protein